MNKTYIVNITWDYGDDAGAVSHEYTAELSDEDVHELTIRLFNFGHEVRQGDETVYYDFSVREINPVIGLDRLLTAMRLDINFLDEFKTSLEPR